ncbi:hypothetical protein EJ05DRAFT_260139 [Pseudovirgaria hyperparasitica]|uniref:Uncharacterized protein n=1 Tax=Pseudovirgaria hyperparasitica TaxID=470096 RepID=A0A6A6WF41_9PEZI|nr:uncharacterized protein EJ05DRAFT_260139 [Pseudovirgaria hyperparasitica]KAF2761343.1 hypothetical protein EJ05DRAFT_260139 [Pseudovirgaria hyperparasitica]
MAPTKIPRFSDLPLNKDDPFHSAWGLYGKDDQLGTLNRLTDEVVLEAAKEIKTGVRISLNWPLDAQAETPFFARQAFHQNLYSKPPRCVNDDVWTLNTQSSSQWDGPRHFGYQQERRFYNGATLEDIHKPGSSHLGIGAWSESSIVSHTILLNYHTQRLAQTPSPTTPFPRRQRSPNAPQSRRRSTAHRHQTRRHPHHYHSLRLHGRVQQHHPRGDADDDGEKPTAPCWAGVEQSEAVLEWIWIWE